MTNPIVPMKDTLPICQNVQRAIAAARVEHRNYGTVHLSPNSWNIMLWELTSAVGPHWKVLDEGTRKVLEIAAAGLRVQVYCREDLADESMELSP